jgi:hypothetical protein
MRRKASNELIKSSYRLIEGEIPHVAYRPIVNKEGKPLERFEGYTQQMKTFR